MGQSGRVYAQRALSAVRVDHERIRFSCDIMDFLLSSGSGGRTPYVQPLLSHASTRNPITRVRLSTRESMLNVAVRKRTSPRHGDRDLTARDRSQRPGVGVLVRFRLHMTPKNKLSPRYKRLPFYKSQYTIPHYFFSTTLNTLCCSMRAGPEVSEAESLCSLLGGCSSRLSFALLDIITPHTILLV